MSVVDDSANDANVGAETTREATVDAEVGAETTGVPTADAETNGESTVELEQGAHPPPPSAGGGATMRGAAFDSGLPAEGELTAGSASELEEEAHRESSVVLRPVRSTSHLWCCVILFFQTLEGMGGRC